MDLFIFAFILFAVVAGVIGLLVKFVIYKWFFTSSIDAIVQYQERFNQQERELINLLNQYYASGQMPDSVKAQWIANYRNAQNSLSHMNSLRKHQGELSIASMKSQAASIGVFVD